MDRLNHPNMEYYRDTYSQSVRWSGEPLEDKIVIIYCEQGFGDIIQFFRYFKYIKAKEIYLHCPVELHRLFSSQGFKVLDKYDPNIPNHDFHILSLDLPSFIKNKIEFPYINVNKLDLEEGLKVGIAWEGSVHSKDRSCPLSYFKQLEGKIFVLQLEILNTSLIKDCDDFDIFSVPKKDFLDTALLINSMDYIISVDTAILHLAGALNKKTYALLHYNFDCRWNYNLYPNMIRLVGDWDENFNALAKHLRNEVK